MKFPFAPLAALMGMSENAAALSLGISGSTMQEYRREGMSWRAADNQATKAGFHPAEVWPEWHDAELEAVGLACACCSELFIPWRKDQRFCGRLCARRWHSRLMKKRERATAAGAAVNRERRRRYYAENAEYERARERRRYWAKKAEVV